MFRIASTGGSGASCAWHLDNLSHFHVRAKRIRQLHLPRAEALGLQKTNSAAPLERRRQKTKAANHNHCRLSARCGNITRSVNSRRTTGSCQLRNFPYSASVFFVSLLLHHSDGFKRDGAIAPLEQQDAERAGLKQIIGTGWRSGTHADFASAASG